ncbi:Hypothetical predicted protein [Cloeon dipterum]|uniref:BZIP domain-containing protein n=1 Tax=Cloeon dipterum TaxID=197152 RepID=A0A8S1CL23_9INSE|nr:Hypothetical predicted protein [Cloeon dipterum]
MNQFEQNMDSVLPLDLSIKASGPKSPGLVLQHAPSPSCSLPEMHFTPMLLSVVAYQQPAVDLLNNTPFSALAQQQEQIKQNAEAQHADPSMQGVSLPSEASCPARSSSRIYTRRNNTVNNRSASKPSSSLQVANRRTATSSNRDDPTYKEKREKNNESARKSRLQGGCVSLSGSNNFSAQANDSARVKERAARAKIISAFMTHMRLYPPGEPLSPRESHAWSTSSLGAPVLSEEDQVNPSRSVENAKSISYDSAEAEKRARNNAYARLFRLRKKNDIIKQQKDLAEAKIVNQILKCERDKLVAQYNVLKSNLKSLEEQNKSM